MYSRTHLVVQRGYCRSSLGDKSRDQLAVLLRQFLIHGGADGLAFAVENDNCFDAFA